MVEDVIYVTRNQIDALLSVITSVRDRAIYTLGYWRGLRACEVGRLHLSHWLPESGQLWVLRAKGSVSGVYTLSQDERKALLAWLKVRGSDPGPIFPSRKQLPISRQQLDKLTKYYGARAHWPVEKCMFKVLRHSIATHLLEKGLEIYAVKDWLGHKTVKSTEVYAKVTNAGRRRAEAQAYADDTPLQSSRDRVGVDWKSDSKRRR
jgi:site-specific recombinase XerD